MALITQLPLFVCKSKNKKTTAITGIGGISWLMTRRSPQVEWPRGICFGGAPVMQGWLGWSQCRVWGSLYWSWPTNPGSGLWILHDHSDWKAMGFDLDMCPQPAAEQVCQKLALVGNPSPIFSGGLLKFHVWNRRRSTIWNNFGKPEHTHALYGGLIVRFKPLKFRIFWDTWGYVWTWATSVTGDKFLISQAAPTLRSEGGGTELLERSWKT